MKITDSYGTAHNIYPYMWNGDRWERFPERVHYQDIWWIIYYLFPTVFVNWHSSFNLDNALSVNFSINIDKILPSGFYNPDLPY
jgi:hypothetical protein